MWVIAETDDLETTFRKIVVTGDDGRFLVPDLPDADYEVWGARLRPRWIPRKQSARPGDELTLEVTAAATPQEAARIYPANYWYSLLEVPAESDFPGTGADGNGISERMRHQAEWVDRLKDGCQLCHQMGNMATREMPMLNLDDFDSTLDAWEHRVQVGRSGPSMSAGLNRMGRERAMGLFADWTDRIAAGRGSAGAAAPAGAGAQPRPDDVGLGRHDGDGPRRDRHRQAQPLPVSGRLRCTASAGRGSPSRTR